MSVADHPAADDALHASATRAQLELLLANIGDAILRLAPDRTILWASPSLQVVLGWEGQDVVGRPFPEALITGTDPVTELVEAIAEHSTNVTITGVAHHRDGSLRWVEARLRLLWSGTQELTMMVASVRDVTETVSSRADLDRWRHRAQATLDAQLDPHALLRALRSPEGEIVDFVLLAANPVLCTMLGRTRVELVGTRVGDLVRPPSQRRALVAGLGRSLRPGAAAGTHPMLRGYRLGARYFDLRAEAVGADEISASAHDVTDRVQAEAELTRSREHFEGLFASLVTGVVVQRADASILEANAEARRILGITALDVLGSSSDGAIAPPWRAVREDGSELPLAEQPAMACLREGRAVRDVVLGIAQPEGRTAWILVSAEPFGGDSTDRAVSTLTDITELQESRARVAATSAELSAVLDQISDVILHYDSHGRLLWASPSLATVFGWDPEAVRGEPFDLSDDPGRVTAELEAQLTSRPDTLSYRFTAFTADGSQREAEARIRVQWDDHGRLVGMVAAIRDISEQVAAQRALEASQAQFRLLAENAADVVFRLGADGTLEWLSPSVSDLLGWPPEALIGRRLEDRVHPGDQATMVAALTRMRAGEPAAVEVRMPTRAGSYTWLALSARPVFDAAGRVCGQIGSCRDITEAHRAREELRFLATHDPLTKLVNRAEVTELLREALSLPMGDAQAVGILFADVDGLKAVNDTHGHAAGDAVIIETARRLRACVRTGDTVARIGGDEFLVVLPSVSGHSGVAKVAAKIRRSLSRPMPWGEAQIAMGASVGVAVARQGEALEAVIERADRDAYREKRRLRE